MEYPNPHSEGQHRVFFIYVVFYSPLCAFCILKFPTHVAKTLL